MTDLPFTMTNHGLKQILQNGSGISWFTLDGDATAPARSDATMDAECSGNGAGRQIATYTDTSVGNTISCTLETDYSFTGTHAINAICLCSAATPGSNMMGRGLLSAVQNVGNQDTISIELTLNFNQVV